MVGFHSKLLTSSSLESLSWMDHGRLPRMPRDLPSVSLQLHHWPFCGSLEQVTRSKSTCQTFPESMAAQRDGIKIHRITNMMAKPSGSLLQMLDIFPLWCWAFSENLRLKCLAATKPWNLNCAGKKGRRAWWKPDPSEGWETGAMPMLHGVFLGRLYFYCN